MSKSQKLSKSRIAEGLVCEKKVFLSVRHPEMKAQISASQQARFDAGNEVGVLARKSFPNGHLIDCEYWEIDKGIQETIDAVSSGTNTVFEASFGNADYHCRIDILHRESSRDDWNLFEVKSGLDPKPEYILDLAIQCWILNSCKIRWKRAHIIHLNRDCLYPDLSNLFVRADVTDAVNDILADIDSDIENIKNVISVSTLPNKSIGRHCEAPYECGFKAHCWKHVPEYSVFDLPNGWKLFEKGRLHLEDVTVKDLTPTQKLPFDVATKNYQHINREGIRASLSGWKFPMYHLDFETIGPAIPRYADTTPYTNVPFQFSLHIQTDLNSEPQHKEYLHSDGSDPRRAIAEKLVEWIPETGGIVVAYNCSFEDGVLRKLADLFPDLADRLCSIADRLVDPHPAIKKNVYFKEFRGGFSIKDVAPVLLGPEWDYARLEVGDGKAAQVAFDEMISTDTPKDKRQLRRNELLKYCSQDTLAMVELTKWLYKQIS